MRFLLLVLVMVFLIGVQPAEAQAVSFRTANDLAQLCQDKKLDELKDSATAMAFGFCRGLFQGLLASSAAATVLAKPLNLRKPLFCAPSGVTPDQARKILLKWIGEHPENLHEDAMPHAVISLMKAFPCKEDDD
mgnify:CR=1 FL=1